MSTSTILEYGGLMRGHARGDVVLFPRIDSGCDGLQLEPVSPALAASRLRQHLLGGPQPSISEVFALSTNPIGADTLDHVCLELATRLRCFDCIVGRNAYPSASGASVLDAVHSRRT